MRQDARVGTNLERVKQEGELSLSAIDIDGKLAVRLPVFVE